MQMFKGWEFERLTFIGVLVLTLGAAGCGAAGETDDATTNIGSVQQGLSPGWSWSTTGVSLISYYDARAIASFSGSGHVTQWSDQTSSNHVTNTGSQGPTQSANAFGTNMDGLDFNGGELLRDVSWSGPPQGSSAPYTVLVIAKSIASQQTSSAVAWWAPNAYDAIRCQIVPSGASDTFLQGSRGYTLSGDQVFTGTANITNNTAHALGWLYTPEVLRTFIDGTTESSSTLTALPSISPNTFLIGARSDLPTQLFTGIIGQVYIFSGNLGSGDLSNFYSYAQANWGVP
jgi:hypothetical protein